jgi:2-aminoethylphosphonate-pyruvate transaminase
MNRDIAPWDHDFRRFMTRLLTRILHLAGGSESEHAALPLQGCGHFITEAALRSFLPPGGRILIPVTGAYANRMIRLAGEAGRVPVPLPVGLTARAEPSAIARALADDPGLSHVGLVYSETGSGVVHDVRAIGAAVRAAGRRMIVDAVSAFGALPLDLSAQPEIDAAVLPPTNAWRLRPGSASRLPASIAC